MGQAGRGDERHIAARRREQRERHIVAGAVIGSEQHRRVELGDEDRIGRPPSLREIARKLAEHAGLLPFDLDFGSMSLPEPRIVGRHKPVPLDVHELENGFERALEVVEIILELLFVRIALRMLQPGQRHAELKPLFREQFRIPAERLADFEQLLGQVSPRDVPLERAEHFAEQARAHDGKLKADRVRETDQVRFAEPAVRKRRFTVHGAVMQTLAEAGRDDFVPHGFERQVGVFAD